MGDETCVGTSSSCVTRCSVLSAADQDGVTRTALKTEGAEARRGAGTANKHHSPRVQRCLNFCGGTAESQGTSGCIFGIRRLLQARAHTVPRGEAGVNIIKQPPIGPRPHPEINPVILHTQWSTVRR